MAERTANQARYFFEPSELSADVLQVADFKGHEKMSQLFQFELNLVSEDPEIPFADVIDKPATLVMMRGDEPYYVHGLVADFQQGGYTSDWCAYTATLVPRLWRLSLTHQSRVFQSMTVEDIVREVLSESGFSSQDFRFSLDSSYPSREYCTQYQETDLNFICRLLEHEGIQFFFEHDDEQETVVFADHSGENPTIADGAALGHHTGGGLVPEEDETIREFIYRERVVTGKVRLKDYNYETPTTDLQAEAQGRDMPGTRYEYAPHIKEQAEGDRIAQVRDEELECQRTDVRGAGNCLRFRAGQRFELQNHRRGDLNQEYLITEVTHVGSQRGGVGTAEDGEQRPDYRNEFDCIPATVQYRPPRVTPVPRLPGIMTAKVESAGGDYAYIDDQGRYRVRMPFDLGDASEGAASKAVRMAQPYSGPNYGMHFPVHEGSEMVFACVDGDVDRPLGLSTVPNPSQSSPVTSENHTQNVIRTASENEIYIEDEKGNERIHLYSPYKNSILQMGSPNLPNEGIAASTDGAVTVQGGNSVTVSAWPEFDSMDFHQILSQVQSVGNLLVGAALPYLTGGINFSSWQDWLGRVKKGASVAGILGGGSPGIFLTAPGSINLATPDGVSVNPLAGFSVLTPADVEIGGGSGVSVLAGGGLNLFSQHAGVRIATVTGDVKAETTGGDAHLLTDQGNIVIRTDGAGAKGTIDVGGRTMDVAAEEGIRILDDTKIEIKCGQSSLELRENGTIILRGKNIQVEGQEKVDVSGKKNVKVVSKKNVDVEGKMGVNLSGMKVNSEGTQENTVKGGMINSKAKGVNVIKGSLTKIG